MPAISIMPGSLFGTAIGLASAVFFLLRQLRPQPIRLRGTVMSSVMFVGLFFWVSLAPHLPKGDVAAALAAALPADLLGVLAGVALGIAFGRAVDVRYDPQRGPLRRASGRLVALWLTLVGGRFILGLVGRSIHLAGIEQIADGLLALAFTSIITRNVVLLRRARQVSASSVRPG
ncbi:MAG: hypothetical protein HY331_16680 [Chloroflexi bacterium]|nr:hypothetical protein [Chloroflexota bacterium]